jgi:DNA invertase Pin-like site-specific DNA recombinase
MKVGYARVSTKEQNLDLQLRALKAEGCGRIFREKMSGKRWDRPQLHAALRSLGKGDVLVVWHLDRLGRTARELINLNYEFKCQGIAIKSLTESLETETPDGEYNFTMSCAQAQRGRDLIALRTRAGLKAARIRGSKLGRPRRLKPTQVMRARTLAQTRGLSVEALAGRFKVGKATMQRALAERRRA